MRSRRLSAGAAGATATKVPERSEIDPQFQWDLAALYKTDAAWDHDFARIDEWVKPIEAMRGKLNSAAAINDCLEAQTELDRLVMKLYSFAHLRQDEDLGNSENQARMGRLRPRLAEISGRLAWITPEILAHSEEDLKAWTDAPELKENRYEMVRLLRRKPHTLSDKEETLLSRAAEVFSAPHQAFSFLIDADMKFPEIEDSEGQKRELSQGRFVMFLLDRDRRVRRDAFNGMYDTFSSFKNTLASTLSSQVKLHNYMTKTRHFDSALEAALHDDHIPVTLYNALIDATHKALPHFYKYLDIRKRQLGLDDLDIYDMHVPIVPEYDIQIPFDQARTWIMEALKPLGTEYMKVLETAFTDGWLDVYENRGKRSGAYSGGCFDSLPYILMNYQDTLSNVFTLVHELGHSMHSWLANHTQSPRFARYPIFVAEVASTLNEALLLRYLLKTADDPKFRAYLLNHLCDSFKGMVYRQTMFAEFEKIIHEMDAGGKPLTPETIGSTYYKLNAEYYGPKIDADKQISHEWSRVPHFYFNFYVYKYATSFCASQIFIRRILEDEKSRDQYLDFLRAGGSADPLDLVRRAGVDLADRATLDGAFEIFAKTLCELDEALKEM